MSWRIYFTEGRRYSSRESKPDDLPKDGVLGIVTYTGRSTRSGVPYRQILSGDDHYFFWGGEWFSNSDPEEEIRQRYPGALILRGQWVPDGEMQRVQAEMARAQEAP